MVVYSKSNFLIEHPRQDKYFYWQLFRRFLAFSFDFLLPGILQMVLIFILGLSYQYLIISSMVSILLLSITFLLVPWLTSRTLGMILAKLYIVHKSGFLTTKRDQVKRGIIAVIFYAPPLMRELSILFAIITSLITKGFSVCDFVSQTIVISFNTKESLIAVEAKEFLKYPEELAQTMKEKEVVNV